MDYERGLKQLGKALSTDSEVLVEFATLETRLRSTLDDERRYGPSEALRHERNRAIDALNKLARDHLGVDFVGLCLPAELPTPRRSPAPADHPWRGGAEVVVHGEVYLLHDPVDEVWAANRSYVRRKAKAWQPEPDRLAWVKQVRVLRDTPAAIEARDALAYEGRLLARFERQPDFPRLSGLDTGGEAVTIAYAFTQGTTLDRAFGPLGQVLDAGRAYRLLRSMRSLCAMLSVLHRKGLSHRYLTPEGIMLLEGQRDHAVLQDLGLAAQPRTPDEGPALYRAPEQSRLDAALALPGPHTDIYQLGAVLYHLLVGRPPSSFLGDVEPPSTWNPAIPPGLDDALLRALAMSPGDRWPTIRDLRDALERSAAQLKDLLRGAP